MLGPRGHGAVFTCALIGPDGAGKTTLCAALPERLPLPVKCIYMGVNPDAGSHLLPTTRLVRSLKGFLGVARPAGGPPPLRPANEPAGGLPRRALRGLRAALRLANRVAEEWYRQAIAWYYQRRGYVVLFDRHYIADYHAHDVRSPGIGAPLSRRVHGYLLRRLYPAPDLVVVLDAPAELLYARKPEGSLEALSRRREEYRSLDEVFPELVVVDASQPLEQVLSVVVEQITAFHQRRLTARERDRA